MLELVNAETTMDTIQDAQGDSDLRKQLRAQKRAERQSEMAPVKASPMALAKPGKIKSFEQNRTILEVSALSKRSQRLSAELASGWATPVTGSSPLLDETTSQLAAQRPLLNFKMASPGSAVSSTRASRTRRSTSSTRALPSAETVADNASLPGDNSWLADGSKGDGSPSPNADGTALFMKRTTARSLLSAVEEKELTMMTKDLLFIERVKKQLAQALQRHPSDEEWGKALNMDGRDLALRRAAGERAKQMMLQSNYRLVMSVCKKYQFKGNHMHDLIAEGIHGLLKGVEKFDPSKGFRFSTYAHWWIRQAITRSLADQGRMVRLPVHLTEMLSKLKSTAAAIAGSTGMEPSPSQVAAACGITLEKYNEVYSSVRAPSSMEAPISESGDGTIADTLEDSRVTPEEDIRDASIVRDIEEILCTLSDREAGVIRMRYGLDDGKEKTLEDVGAFYNVTRERIRQIEAKGLLKLKALQQQPNHSLSEYERSDEGGGEWVTRSSMGTRKT
ncbi:MAG: hypothetical protein WDW36_004606 [Sanguina aurantia]